MKTVKVVGCGGYGGMGIVELLLRHPEAKIQTLVAATETGGRMGDMYPHLAGFCDLPILAPDDPAAQEPADIVFFSTPDGVGMRNAAAELAKGAKVIDYSGDFRFNSTTDYAEYARRLGKDPAHAAPELLAETVYGLPEINCAAYAADQRLVGNPGCFAVSCLLGLFPAVSAKLVETDSLICDCKTGVSGAGKKPSPAHHYPARYDNMNAYRLSGHQHVMEVERYLGGAAGEPLAVTFTAQVVPTCRGIMSTLYGTLKSGVTLAQICEAYHAAYQDSPFIRLYPANANIGTAQVRGSNFANLVLDVDERTNRLRVVAYIDNLMKGQAGNALQNMNILCGFPETLGLNFPAAYP